MKKYLFIMIAVCLCSCGIVTAYGDSSNEIVDILKLYPEGSYALNDINNDGVLELIVYDGEDYMFFSRENDSYCDAGVIENSYGLYKTENGVAVNRNAYDSLSSGGWSYVNYTLVNNKITEGETIVSYEYGFSPDYEIYKIGGNEVDKAQGELKLKEAASRPIDFQTYTFTNCSNYSDAYKMIIEQYANASSEIESGSNSILTDKYPEVSMEFIMGGSYSNSNLSYALKDIDKNGVPELFIASRINYNSSEWYDKYNMWSICTFKDGVIYKLAEDMGNRWECWLLNTDEVFELASGGADYNNYYTFALKDTYFDYTDLLSCDGSYLFNNGSQISESKGNEITEQKYNSIVQLDWKSVYDFKVEESNSISVILNNRELTFDAEPYIENGTTMVPMRAIFEALGAEVLYDAETKTITAVKGGTSIELVTGSNTAKINGSPQSLSVAVANKNGSTMIPLRFVSEALGAAVDWNGETKVVTITD